MTKTGTKVYFLLACIVVCLSFGSLMGKNTFVITPNLAEAQKNIASLRLDAGKTWLEAERKTNPNNAAIQLFENYIDFFKILCLQNETDFKAFEKNKAIRVEALKKVDDSNPYKLYGQAEIHLQSAFLKGMFEEYLGAAWDFRSCYQLLEQNQKKFPQFITNKKDIGILQAILGTIPESYQWIVSIAGMKGNLKQGLQLLKEYVDKAESDKEITMELKNAQYFYTLFYLNFMKNKTETWKLTEKYTVDYKTNLLAACIRGFAAKATDHTDECIEALQNRPTSHEYIAFPYMEMMLGSALLYKLDLSAVQHFKKFVASNKDASDNKEAYTKLAWCAWLKSDTSTYWLYAKIAHNISDKGNKNKLASNGGVDFFPETTLLKARLLFDGGYYTQAEEIMLHKPVHQFKTELEKVEYTYRLGRIYHESNKLSKAIEFYEQTVKANFKENEFMAANSCLQLGYIYEKLNFKQLAKTHFNKVFDYKNAEYKNSLQQKAKAALEKL